MEHNLLTLDFWQDTVTYENSTVPTGTLGCETLNIPDETIQRLTVLCEPLNRFLGVMQSGTVAEAETIQEAGAAALALMELLRSVPPFSRIDMDFYKPSIERAFTRAGFANLQAYSTAVYMGTLTAENTEEYKTGILLGRITPTLAHLGYALAEYKKELMTFAEAMDSKETDRSPDGLAALFGQTFPPDFEFFNDVSWMSMTNVTVQYRSVLRPGMEVPMLVKRMNYVTFVGLLRSDLFEGLCVGHAPKKCPICGRWFLTTNARHTKYCGNLAPGDSMGRTCRQIGALRGREHRELADDHPLKQIYERRLNTINRYVKRGTLDEATAKAMKKLAKNKMLRAISDVRYAQSRYKEEMVQDALLAEAAAKR